MNSQSILGLTIMIVFALLPMIVMLFSALFLKSKGKDSENWW